MIIRYHLKCNYCKKITLLRIGVGHQSKQPFQFECEGCSQDISCVLNLDQVNGIINDLEVDAAVEVDGDQSDYLITYNPDFPTEIRTPDDGANYPFLAAFGRHGLSLLERGWRSNELQSIADSRTDDIVRIIRNYKAQRWERFQKDVLEFLPDDWSLDHPIDRNAALYQILELVLAPLITSENHVQTIKFIAGYVGHACQITDVHSSNFWTRYKGTPAT